MRLEAAETEAVRPLAVPERRRLRQLVGAHAGETVDDPVPGRPMELPDVVERSRERRAPRLLLDAGKREPRLVGCDPRRLRDTGSALIEPVPDGHEEAEVGLDEVVEDRSERPLPLLGGNI